jgi:hypothetical protein
MTPGIPEVRGFEIFPNPKKSSARGTRRRMRVYGFIKKPILIWMSPRFFPSNLTRGSI